MTTKIIASTLVNRVTWQSDLASLKRVRKQLKDLRAEFSANAARESQATIRRAKEAADAQIREARRVAREQRRLATNRGGAGAGSNRGSNRGGSGGSGRSGGRSEADREARRAAKEQERQQAKQRRDEEKRIRQQGSRDERAALMRRSRSFNISQMDGLNAQQRHEAVRNAARISEQYRNGALSIQAANEALRQQDRLLRSIARDQRNANRRAGAPQPHHSRLAAGLAATGVIGGIGFGAERLAGAAGRTLQGSIERNGARQQLQTFGISDLEAQALINQVRARTGKTLTYENLADQAKDMQEKTGELSLGKWSQAKDGSWSLGSAGEMADLVNAVTQRGGKAAGQQVQQNLQGMNYVEYLVYLRQLQKQFRFTDQQMTFFAETVNDGSLALGGIDQTGKNLDDTMKSIARNGGAVTEQQSANLTYLSNLGSVAQAASDNLNDSFSAAFAGRMKELGIGADETRESFAELKPIMKDLGRTVGDVTAWFSKALGIIPGSASYNKQHYQEAYNSALEHKESNPLSRWAAMRYQSNSTAGEAGWNDAMNGKPMDNRFVPENIAGNQSSPIVAAALDQRAGAFYGGNPFSMPALNQSLNTNVTVQVDDVALKNAFTSLADTRIDDAFGYQTWEMNQSLMKN